MVIKCIKFGVLLVLSLVTASACAPILSNCRVAETEGLLHQRLRKIAEEKIPNYYKDSIKKSALEPQNAIVRRSHYRQDTHLVFYEIEAGSRQEDSSYLEMEIWLNACDDYVDHFWSEVSGEEFREYELHD